MLRLRAQPEETIIGSLMALRAGNTTSRELVEKCLAQIDKHELRIQAWVSVDRNGALARAAELDRDFGAGRWQGPLHGIPLGIKDIIDVAGFPTAAGSPLRSAQIAARDATLVNRLRRAGAIILGKTVTTQFAGFDPPPTRNPWNTNHTPGGSSSGSAAAVAQGMCLGAIGSQTGGSITRPASFCGVAGCKPTFGRVSLHGIVPLAKSMDHAGPIARSVADLALLLDVIAGPDSQDPSCLKAAPPSLSAAVEARPFAPPRLGRLGGLFDDKAQPAARLKFEAALQLLAAAGAAITPAWLPAGFDVVLVRHRGVMAPETASYHAPQFSENRHAYLPHIRSLIEEGLSQPAIEYVRCREHQTQLTQEIDGAFAQADVLVCPATIGPAPDCSTTGDPSFNAPWSYTGSPTLTIPVAISAEGLPLGLQLVGRRSDETSLFRAAAWCESTLAKSSAPNL